MMPTENLLFVHACLYDSVQLTRTEMCRNMKILMREALYDDLDITVKRKLSL